MEGRKQTSLISLLLFVLVVVTAVSGAIGAGWLLGTRRAAQNNESPAPERPSLSAPSEPAKALRTYTAENLFYKCETNTITEQTEWKTSEAEVIYQDLNNDSVEDVLVSARIPGVAESVRACVFTVTQDRLRSLWRLNNSQLIEKSQIGIDGFGRIAYTGTRATNGTPRLVTDYYLWSNESGTFVLN